MSRVQLSIDMQQLASLLRKGDLHLNQLAPLDVQSKSALWQLCLNCCDGTDDSELASQDHR